MYLAIFLEKALFNRAKFTVTEAFNLNRQPYTLFITYRLIYWHNIPHRHLEGSATVAAASSVYMGSYSYALQLKLPAEKWLPCLSEHSISVQISTDEDLTSRIVSMFPGYIGEYVTTNDDMRCTFRPQLTYIYKISKKKEKKNLASSGMYIFQDKMTKCLLQTSSLWVTSSPW